MFKSRLISGIVLVIILLMLGIMGGNVLLAGLGVISVVGLHELYKVFHIEKSAMGYVGYVAVVIYYFSLKYIEIEMGTFLLSMLLMIVFMAVYVFSFPKYKADQVMAAFFGDRKSVV